MVSDGHQPPELSSATGPLTASPPIPGTSHLPRRSPIPTSREAQTLSLLESLFNKRATAKFATSKLLLFGDPDVGKRSLVAALQKEGLAQNQKHGELEILPDTNSVGVLEFAYMNVVSPEDGEPIAQTHVFIANNNSNEVRNLLVQSVSVEDVPHTAAVICLSLLKGSKLRVELRKWLSFANEVAFEMTKRLPIDEQDVMKTKLSRYVASYRNHTSQPFSTADRIEDPARRDEFQVNAGIPMAVAVCKADGWAYLDSRKSPGCAQVVAAHLRESCLAYGAALFYVSTKQPASNIEALYCYLLHRLYNFEFSFEANVQAQDRLLIPAGWDSRADLEAYIGTTIAKTFEIPYESVVNVTAEEAVVPVQLSALSNPAQFMDFNETLSKIYSGTKKVKPSASIAETNQREQQDVPKERSEKGGRGEPRVEEHARPRRDEDNIREFFDSLIKQDGATARRGGLSSRRAEEK